MNDSVGSRAGARMVFDGGYVLLHGGISTPFSGGSIFSDPGPDPDETTYSWRGDSWRPMTSGGPKVWGFGAGFDRARGVLVTVGGFKKWDEQGLTAEHWELRSELTWTNLGSPIPGRGHPAMAYDSKRRRVVVVGGVSGQPGFDTGRDVYEYDPTRGWITLPRFPGTGRGGS